MKFIAISLSLFFIVSCAEKNFVPGSPMAKMMGYNRTYEEIASDDCSNKYNFNKGTQLHSMCVVELSSSRRQSDAAYMKSMAALSLLGSSIANSSTVTTSNAFTTPSVGGVLVNSYISGFNNLCVYDTVKGVHVKTIPLASGSCPISF